MKSERKTVLVKVESPSGTDSSPSAGTDAFAAIDFAWNGAAKSVTDEFEYAKGYYGARDKFMVSLTRECGFTLPVIGAGTPLGTNYAAALLACYRMAGLAATVTAATSVVFNPVNSGEESATLSINEDGFLRKMLFSRANLVWTGEEGKVPRCRASVLGLYSTPADQVVPATTYPTLQKPVGFSKSNTVVTLGALTPKCKSFTWDGGRTWSYRNMAGAEDIVPIDCKPTAELVFELPTATVKNLYQELESTAEQALSIAHGTVAGNRFTLAATKAQLVDMSETKDRGVIFVTTKFELLPTTGGDQFTVTLT